MGILKAKVLIFDIGGTVFDWTTAIVDTLDRLFPAQVMSASDRLSFALKCRAKFLELNGAIGRGERPWLPADQILAAVMDDLLKQTGLPKLTVEKQETRTGGHKPLILPR